MLKFFAILALLLFSSTLSYSQSTSIGHVYGASIACDTSQPGCVHIPLNVSILCDGVGCSRLAVPDWNNANIVYGTDASNCRKSLDGGVTWINCPSNPSLTDTLTNYAVTSNSTVLASGNNSGGTAFIIKRSTDGGSTWNTVYSNAMTDAIGTSVLNLRLRCSQTIQQCIYFGKDGASQLFSIVSTDDGQTWTLSTNLGFSLSGWFPVQATNDLSNGFGSVATSDGTGNYRDVLISGTSVSTNPWSTGTVGGLCNWSFILNGVRRSICHQTATGQVYTVRDQNGGVINSFTLPSSPSDNGNNGLGQSISLPSIKNTLWMFRPSSSGTGMWLSVDSGNTFSFQGTFTPRTMSGVSSMFFSPNGCILGAFGGTATTSVVFQVC